MNEIPFGRCLICEQIKQMWRCVDITGGGTFHGICLECHDKHTQQNTHTTIWILATDKLPENRVGKIAYCEDGSVTMMYYDPEMSIVIIAAK